MKNVFKRKTVAAPPAPPSKTDPVQAAIDRGERVKSLANEAQMWREFSTGCEKGRWIQEHVSTYSGWTHWPYLRVTMDEDSALLWRDFANRMAEERERRLRDIVGSTGA